MGLAESAGASSSARIAAIDTQRLVPEHDERAIDRAVERLDPDPQRARQAPTGIRVPDAPLAAPLDRLLDGRGVVAEHDDDVSHPCLRDSIQHVLQDRPPLERRQELAAAEPGPRAGREDHRGHRPCRHPAIAGTRSFIGRPEPP